MQRRRSLIVAAFMALTLLAVGAEPVAACICLEAPPPRTALREAKAVFVGLVVEVSVDDEPKVSFRPSKVWKGVEVGANLVSVTSPILEGCTFVFTEGEEYLVYAYDGQADLGVNSPLATNACTSTVKLAQAGDDLHQLPNPEWSRCNSGARSRGRSLRP